MSKKKQSEDFDAEELIETLREASENSDVAEQSEDDQDTTPSPSVRKSRPVHDGLVEVVKIGRPGRSGRIMGKATKTRYEFDATVGSLRMHPRDARSIVDGVEWEYGRE